MKKSFLLYVKLTRMYVSVVFNPKRLFGATNAGAPRAAAFRRIGKIAGILLLFLPLLIEGVVFYGLFQVGLYTALQPYGLQNMMFIITGMLSVMLLLCFGSLHFLAAYYTESIDNNLLSLPVSEHSMLAAKITVLSIGQIAGSAALFIPMLAVYGFYEQPSVLFYVYGLLCALMLPVPLAALLYAFFILLMNVFPAFKKKLFISVLGSVLSVGIVVGINYFFQSKIYNTLTGENIFRMFMQVKDLFQMLAVYYPPVAMMCAVLKAPHSVLSGVYLVGFFFSTVAFVYAVIILFSKKYIHSLYGFNELKIKKMTKEKMNRFLRTRVKRKMSFFALLVREIKILNRDPVFLLNGPFSMILLPVIIGFSVYGSLKGRNGFGLENIAAARYFFSEPEGIMIFATIMAWIGSLSDITVTALSRDAKNILAIKALPVNPVSYFYAKFMHGMLVSLSAMILLIGIAAIVLHFSIFSVVHSTVCAVMLVFDINILGLFFDMDHPYLHWVRPEEVFKKSIRNVLFKLVNMLFSVLLIGGIIFFPVANYVKLLVLESICTVLAGIFAKVLVKKSYYCFAQLGN